MQAVLAEVLESRDYQRTSARIRQQLASQMHATADAVLRHFPKGTRIRKPQGGMLLWVEMPDGRSGLEVFEAALRQGIRVAPGAMFSNSTRYNHFLRISCGQRHTPEIARALATLARIVAERQP